MKDADSVLLLKRSWQVRGPGDRVPRRLGLGSLPKVKHELAQRGSPQCRLALATRGHPWRSCFVHLVGGLPDEQAWQQIALLEGLTSMPVKAPKGKGKTPPRVVTLPTAPETLEKMRRSPNSKIAAAAESLAKQLNWPGKDGKPIPVLPPLSSKHQALYDQGRKEYLALCAACHHPAGFGDAGKGPPLVDSDWLDNDERLVRLVLHGVRGPVTVNDDVFNPDSAMEMPGMYQLLDDQKIAAILTFVRREWRDRAAPMNRRPSPASAPRQGPHGPVTEKELLQFAP